MINLKCQLKTSRGYQTWIKMLRKNKILVWLSYGWVGFELTSSRHELFSFNSNQTHLIKYIKTNKLIYITIHITLTQICLKVNT